MKWFNEAIASPEMAAVVRAQAPLWARNGHVHTIVACTTRPGSSLGRLKTLVQQWNISILICCVACRPATFLCRRMFPEYFRHSNFQCVILRSHKFPKCVILCVHLVMVWGLEHGVCLLLVFAAAHLSCLLLVFAPAHLLSVWLWYFAARAAAPVTRLPYATTAPCCAARRAAPSPWTCWPAWTPTKTTRKVCGMCGIGAEASIP